MEVNNLLDAARSLLTPMGYEVLELLISSGARKRRILLRIDRLDGKVVSMDDIVLATQVFSLELDRLNPLDGSYHLEVESPGPERPLFRPEHFKRFHDLAIKVRTKNEQFKGIIREVNEEGVNFEVDKTQKAVAFEDIQSARLAEWPKEPR
ncbi:MAG: ribosome maturation factor RimP [Deinococcales bacterium]